MQKKINLTEGGIVEKLVKIAIPIMATSFIQIAYNNRYDVGRKKRK